LNSKIYYPFIYFLMEPNIVFVYKIETHKYLTINDLSKGNQWETFELHVEETFEQFNHKENKKLEGKGYFISQDNLILMVEEINKNIQMYRHSNEENAIPVHIVSPEFSAGSIRVAIDRPKQVIGFPDFFSMGPLWKLDEKVGQTFRNEWLFENINLLEDDDVYQNKFANTLRDVEDISSNVPIYIWCGDNAEEQTALRFILYLLKDMENEVYLINSTELYKKYISSVKTVCFTGRLEPEILRALFEKGKKIPPLSITERIQFISEWQTLSQTKEVLRIWKNDKIEAVQADYYDQLLINTILELHQRQETKDFIKTNEVIGELIPKMEGSVGWFFLEYRIRHLVYSGVLELKGIPKSMRHYSVKVRGA
jgi:hypothetical protein